MQTAKHLLCCIVSHKHTANLFYTITSMFHAGLDFYSFWTGAAGGNRNQYSTRGVTKVTTSPCVSTLPGETRNIKQHTQRIGDCLTMRYINSLLLTYLLLLTRNSVWTAKMRMNYFKCLLPPFAGVSVCFPHSPNAARITKLDTEMSTMNLDKLALYETDGRLFTTDVSAKFKVTWHKN